MHIREVLKIPKIYHLRKGKYINWILCAVDLSIWNVKVTLNIFLTNDIEHFLSKALLRFGQNVPWRSAFLIVL
jgi:hypothetical protein